ncbi:SMI1/KNR4 family protein [Chitinophaga defluvii]|uniref:SMI1/KNR4 family protein n=1 Tax=Chitinophaga defluvii TaxID=3163343 RepID=A0ABV2TEE3_9BACT
MHWINTEKLVTESSIIRVERDFKINFPIAFKSLIRQHNHGAPLPNLLHTPDQQPILFGRLLNFNLNRKNDVLEHYAFIQYRIPPGVFPIAVNPAVDYLCFDFRHQDTAPSIIILPHLTQGPQKAPVWMPLASDLNELLNLLKTRPQMQP